MMQREILVILENKPGALARIVGLFHQRGYNIESLHVDPVTDIENYKDKGYKWNFYIMQCAGVYNKNGEQIRYGYEDEDVCRLNGIDPLMLEDSGCITMGWCDG